MWPTLSIYGCSKITPEHPFYLYARPLRAVLDITWQIFAIVERIINEIIKLHLLLR